MSRAAYPKTITNRWGEVKIYETKNGEGGRWTAYLIRWRRGKQRFQEKLSDETKALNRAKEILDSIKAGEEVVAKGAKEKLSYYVALEQMLPPGADLLQAVKFYIDHVGGTSPIKVSEVCERYTASLEQRSLSEVHLNSVRSHLTHSPVVGNFEYSLTTSARMAPEPSSVTSLREIGHQPSSRLRRQLLNL